MWKLICLMNNSCVKRISLRNGKENWTSFPLIGLYCLTQINTTADNETISAVLRPSQKFLEVISLQYIWLLSRHSNNVFGIRKMSCRIMGQRSIYCSCWKRHPMPIFHIAPFGLTLKSPYTPTALYILCYYGNTGKCGCKEKDVVDNVGFVDRKSITLLHSRK